MCERDLTEWCNLYGISDAQLSEVLGLKGEHEARELREGAATLSLETIISIKSRTNGQVSTIAVIKNRSRYLQNIGFWKPSIIAVSDLNNGEHDLKTDASRTVNRRGHPKGEY